MPLVRTVTDINALIDDRNKTLWEQILGEYTVSIEFSLNEEHGCFTKSNDAILYVPKSNICIDSFTHELLHIYIRLKQVFIEAGIQLSFQASPSLSPIFITELCEHIANCLDHLKMLPIYLKLGFKKDKFLLDYHKPKCTDKEIVEIKTYYKIGKKIFPKAAEFFIAKFFAMKADPNDSFNYSFYLEGLERTDEPLYTTLDNYLQAWNCYDFDRCNPLSSNYRALTSNFQSDLENWAAGHNFFVI